MQKDLSVYEDTPMCLDMQKDLSVYELRHPDVPRDR